MQQLVLSGLVPPTGLPLPASKHSLGLIVLVCIHSHNNLRSVFPYPKKLFSKTFSGDPEYAGSTSIMIFMSMLGIVQNVHRQSVRKI